MSPSAISGHHLDKHAPDTRPWAWLNCNVSGQRASASGLGFELSGSSVFARAYSTCAGLVLFKAIGSRLIGLVN